MSRNPVCQFRVTHVTFRNLDPSSALSSVVSEVRVFSAGVGQNEREGSGFPALTIEGPGLSVWGFLFVCSCYPVYVFNILDALRQGFSQ